MKKIKFIQFINEYKQLCKKYNLHIDSCGCCQSPWVASILPRKEEINREGKNFDQLLKEHIDHLHKNCLDDD